MLRLNWLPTVATPLIPTLCELPPLFGACPRPSAALELLGPPSRPPSPSPLARAIPDAKNSSLLLGCNEFRMLAKYGCFSNCLDLGRCSNGAMHVLIKSASSLHVTFCNPAGLTCSVTLR